MATPMPIPMAIPLSLYVHIPWCVKKCPYCDFNSYAVQAVQQGSGSVGTAAATIAATATLPERDYIAKLEYDLLQDLPYVFERPLQSIFFGGGTPSLFSPQAFEKILNMVKKHLKFSDAIEITLEANPGTLEHKHFKDYVSAGINRVSLGVQSFQEDKLQALGRIHRRQELFYAFDSLAKANLHNFNIDIMYGLPNQSVIDALYDLETALNFLPAHLSWYHLTLEPNTYFHKYPPVLPKEEITENIQEEGSQFLKSQGYHQYEVSAFSKLGMEAKHNLNYWTFGDYLGIGAGAHGKLTNTYNKTILRTAKTRTPSAYLNHSDIMAEKKFLEPKELPFEFMLNALRLMNEIPFTLFEERCFLSREVLSTTLEAAAYAGFIKPSATHLILTEHGKRYLNNVLQLFLEES